MTAMEAYYITSGIILGIATIGIVATMWFHANRKPLPAIGSFAGMVIVLSVITPFIRGWNIEQNTRECHKIEVTTIVTSSLVNTNTIMERDVCRSMIRSEAGDVIWSEWRL